jgi:hypothetical protein
MKVAGIAERNLFEKLLRKIKNENLSIIRIEK